MSRTTHDVECFNCGYQGKVNDDSITCPKCRQSIEGKPVDLAKINADIQSRIVAESAIVIPPSTNQ